MQKRDDMLRSLDSRVKRLEKLIVSLQRGRLSEAELEHGTETSNGVEVYSQKSFSEGLVDGKPWFGEQFPNNLARLVIEGKIDLVVNELANRLIIHRGTARQDSPLHRVPPKLQMMLWLVLSNYGRSISYSAIASRLRLNAQKGDGMSNAIHATRFRFNACIGSLHKDIFEVAAIGAYGIRSRGWSFVWIRGSPRREESWLLGDGRGDAKTLTPVEPHCPIPSSAANTGARDVT